MEILHSGLNQIRKTLPEKEWQQYVRSHARNHPIRELLHQDPFTLRSFEKPRGYAGDAELIDFIYGEGQWPTQASPLGQEICEFLNQQPSAVSVRERRQLLAAQLDQVAERIHPPRVLSVACGHLREALLSRAVAEDRIEELVAFDQDPESLAVVRQDLVGRRVRPVQGSVRSLLAGKHDLGDFDFVYSAGLFDYLADRLASRLVAQMFSMLRPGGKLWVANFCKNLSEAGYMESFMDWWLILRDEPEVAAFCNELPRAEVASTRMFHDSSRNVIYLEVVKAG
jgi:extracellular factor (EF) 3-hydroxypalmitic acid methyl ester biosynthesis protein